MISIRETKDTFDWGQADKGVVERSYDRQPLKAYTNGKNGEEITSDSKYIPIKMVISPNEGRYFFSSPEPVPRKL